MDITLLLPDALTVPAIRLTEFSERASRLFARWRVLTSFEDTRLVPLEMPWEQWLRKTCGLPAPSSVEAASAFFDQQPQGCWRVTPVHLHAGLDHVRLDPPEPLGLTLEDSRALAESIRPLLSETGLRLIQPHAMRWYLQAENPKAASLLPEDAYGWRSASGRSIEAFMPVDSAARAWRRLLTEIQMTWHEHPVNNNRQDQGKASVNSLWLDGRAAHASQFPFDACYSELEAVTGLALSAGLRPTGDVRLCRWDREAPCGSMLVVPDLAAHDPSAEIGEPTWVWDQVTAWCGASHPRLAQAIAPLSSPQITARTVVLTGNRRQIVLRQEAADRWKFWRSLSTADWFEWADRDR